MTTNNTKIIEVFLIFSIIFLSVILILGFIKVNNIFNELNEINTKEELLYFADKYKGESGNFTFPKTCNKAYELKIPLSDINSIIKPRDCYSAYKEENQKEINKQYIEQDRQKYEFNNQ